ncbi:MAG: EAL domain-containing protein [Nitrospirota bacterium]
MIHKAYKVIVTRTCPSCGLGFTNTIAKNVYECNYSQCHARFDFSIFSDEEIRKALNTENGEARAPEASSEESGAPPLDFSVFSSGSAEERQRTYGELPERAGAAGTAALNGELTPERVESLENSLVQAIGRGELVVHYQPQIDSSLNRVTGAEALVRWNHPERGLLVPEEFLPLAEESGLIVALDEWVLRTACEQVSAWQSQGRPPLRVTVNLSARQFRQPQLIETVSRALNETGLGPERLEIEITEAIALQDIELAVATLQQLQELGVTLSLDDFGTGYSSLNYLRKLPVQRIKIDRTVTRGITENPDDLAVVRAVVAMGSGLGLKAVAEGVETIDQLMLLQKNGCDEVQGFYFSRPLPPDEFAAFKVIYK